MLCLKLQIRSFSKCTRPLQHSTLNSVDAMAWVARWLRVWVTAQLVLAMCTYGRTSMHMHTIAVLCPPFACCRLEEDTKHAESSCEGHVFLARWLGLEYAYTRTHTHACRKALMEKASRRLWEQLTAKDGKIATEIDTKVCVLRAVQPPKINIRYRHCESACTIGKVIHPNDSIPKLAGMPPSCAAGKSHAYTTWMHCYRRHSDNAPYFFHAHVILHRCMRLHVRH